VDKDKAEKFVVIAAGGKNIDPLSQNAFCFGRGGRGEGV
jgi:hypothetical protein